MGSVTFEGFLLHTYGDLLESFSVSNALEWHMFYPLVSKGSDVPHTEGERTTHLALPLRYCPGCTSHCIRIFYINNTIVGEDFATLNVLRLRIPFKLLA